MDSLLLSKDGIHHYVVITDLEHSVNFRSEINKVGRETKYAETVYMFVTQLNV